MFDGVLPHLSRLDKLRRLLELAQKANGDQGSYCSCLFHDALADPILSAAGMPSDRWLTARFATRETYDWFGIDEHEHYRVFGIMPINAKRRFLASLIASAERSLAGK